MYLTFIFNIQETLDYPGGRLTGLRINHGCFSPPPHPLTTMSDKEFMHKLACEWSVWFAVDSIMLGWGCDKCVLSDRLMLHSLHSNIRKKESF
jgi:hypothetical protein